LRINNPGVPDDESPNPWFADAWSEIEYSPLFREIRGYLDRLVRLTQEKVKEEWVKNDEEVLLRWQYLLERIAYLTIREDWIRRMSRLQIIKFAFRRLIERLEFFGWVIEGEVIMFMDIATVENKDGRIIYKPVFLDLCDPFAY
jgi:hypothetical protein